MLSPSITLIAEKDTGKGNVFPSLVSAFNTIKGRQTVENPVSSQYQSPALGASGIESSIKAQECIHKTNRGKQQSRSLHKGILSLLICRSHLSPPKATLPVLLCLEVLTFSAILSSKYRIGLKLQRWGGSVKQRNNLHLTGVTQSSGLSKLICKWNSFVTFLKRQMHGTVVLRCHTPPLGYTLPHAIPFGIQSNSNSLSIQYFPLNYSGPAEVKWEGGRVLASFVILVHTSKPGAWKWK